MNNIYYKYIALDKEFKVVKDITDIVEPGGSIEYNALTTLKASIDFTVSIPKDKEFDLYAVRVYRVLNNVETLLGTFICAYPETETEICQTIDIAGYSTLCLISDNIPATRYYLPKGTNCVAEIKRILNSLNIAYDIPDCTGATGLNREWAYKSYLEIINDLLDTVNYTSLYVDVNGTYRARPYVSNPEPELTLNGDNLDIKQKVELTKWGVANRFIRYCGNAPDMDLVAVYDVSSEGDVIVTDVEEIEDSPDYETLYNRAKNDCYRARSKFKHVELTTDITTFTNMYMPCVLVNQYSVQNEIFIVNSFKYNLDISNSMEINARRSVDV